MATKAEALRSENQRHGLTAKARKRNAARKSRATKQPMKRAASKATYAIEETSAGRRPSRKSTRKSANRAKPDASLNAREQVQKGSPENRFRKSKVRATRVRGSS